MHSLTTRADQARQFHRVPDEMKEYRQWLVWLFVASDEPGGKPKKVPRSPDRQAMASVIDPNTWGSFADALSAFDRGGFDGIGFVFTNSDPYAGIDFDDCGEDRDAKARQDEIFNQMATYAEFSPSGTGLHLIVKGNVLRGRRRSNIEIYSNERYFTMTGDVYRDLPILECDELLNMYWHILGGVKTRETRFDDVPQREDDHGVVERARGALNGEKFFELHSGRWRERYASQSQADFAYVDMLAFYTQNREQLRRMFRASPLGQRPKAQRGDYVDTMIERAFDRRLPPVDIEAIQAALSEAIAAKRPHEGGAA